MHCHPNYLSESMPVDININAIIAMTYKRSLIANDEILYINIADSGTNPITWGESVELGKKLFYEYPMSISLWYPNGTIKSNYYVHMLCVVFFHYLPAYFIDGLLFLTGNKPFMINIQKRISDGLKVLQYYTTRKWTFRNENFKKLQQEMNDADKEKFYCDVSVIDQQEHVLNYILGIRKFILRETLESLPKARINLKRLYFLDKFVKLTFFGAIIYFLISFILT